MADIIYLDGARKRKEQRTVIELIDREILKHRASLSRGFREKMSLSDYPIAAYHRRHGREFCANSEKGEIFQSLEWVRGQGYTDLKIERTALDWTPEGVRVLENNFAIYGKPPE